MSPLIPCTLKDIFSKKVLNPTCNKVKNNHALFTAAVPIGHRHISTLCSSYRTASRAHLMLTCSITLRLADVRVIGFDLALREGWTRQVYILAVSDIGTFTGTSRLGRRPSKVDIWVGLPPLKSLSSCLVSLCKIYWNLVHTKYAQS